jgi:hypothetical protein
MPIEAATVVIVWGSFNQHNVVVSKLEQHVGMIGKRFLFENLTDVTIDDKLRHTSNTFSSYGLQRTGFRGSRCGTVMNGAGSSNHVHLFQPKGRLRSLNSLISFRSLGYGEEHFLKYQLDVVVFLDRDITFLQVI